MCGSARCTTRAAVAHLGFGAFVGSPADSLSLPSSQPWLSSRGISRHALPSVMNTRAWVSVRGGTPAY